MENLVIVGTGKSADYFYEFIRYHKLYNVIGFAVNSSYLREDNTSFKGLPVYALESLKEELSQVDFKMFVGLMWHRLNEDRRAVFEYCRQQGFQLTSLISPNSVIMCNAKVGVNCFIGDYTVLKSGACIEDDCILAGNNIIGEYNQVCSHTFFSLQSVTGGYSKVGEQSFIGMHATVNDNTVVGRKCIIGSGVTIRRNVPPFTVVSMTDAPLKIRTYDENTIINKLRADIVPR